MTLKDLQEMIKEELDSYMNEAEVNVDVDSDDVDAGDMGGNDSEDMLRKIYDMLKDKFEAEEEDPMDEEMDETKHSDMDEDMMDEVKDDDKKDEAADMEERASQGFGDPGAKNSSGPNAGLTPAKTTKGDGKLHEGKSQLAERFQKLANIIK